MVSSTRRQRRGRTASERGASEAFLLIFLSILLGFAGVAYDAGMAFNARRQATNFATAGARAGANVIDKNELYDSGRALLVQDQGAIEAGVRKVIPTALVDIKEVTPSSARTEVFVRVELTHTPIFLSAFGVGDFVMTGEASSRVSNGS